MNCAYWICTMWWLLISLFTLRHWRRQWQPTPAFLPGESQGRGSRGSCRLWGCRVGHDWSDSAAAAYTCETITKIKILNKYTISQSSFMSLSCNTVPSSGTYYYGFLSLQSLKFYMKGIIQYVHSSLPGFFTQYSYCEIYLCCCFITFCFFF